MKTQSFIPLVAAMMLAFNSFSQDGASIFKKNCAVCHSIGKGKLVGPDLKGVDKKHEIKWLTQWVKSSQKMITKKKDPAAVQLFTDNNKMIMPDQAVSDDEIKTIMAFIGDETTKLTQPAVAVSVPVPAPTIETSGSSNSTSDSTGITSKTIIYILTGIILFLTTILFFLSRVIKNLSESYKN